MHTDFKFYLAVGLVLGVAGVLLLPFCNFMFKCGCRLPWSGATEFCNINIAGVPHCPWCEKRNLVVQAAPFLAVFAGQIGSMYWVRCKFGFNFAGLFAVGLAMFFILATLNGLFFKMISGYPYFF